VVIAVSRPRVRHSVGNRVSATPIVTFLSSPPGVGVKPGPLSTGDHFFNPTKRQLAA